MRGGDADGWTANDEEIARLRAEIAALRLFEDDGIEAARKLSAEREAFDEANRKLAEDKSNLESQRADSKTLAAKLADERANLEAQELTHLAEAAKIKAEKEAFDAAKKAFDEDRIRFAEEQALLERQKLANDDRLKRISEERLALEAKTRDLAALSKKVMDEKAALDSIKAAEAAKKEAVDLAKRKKEEAKIEAARREAEAKAAAEAEAERRQKQKDDAIAVNLRKKAEDDAKKAAEDARRREKSRMQSVQESKKQSEAAKAAKKREEEEKKAFDDAIKYAEQEKRKLKAESDEKKRKEDDLYSRLYLAMKDLGAIDLGKVEALLLEGNRVFGPNQLALKPLQVASEPSNSASALDIAIYEDGEELFKLMLRNIDLDKHIENIFIKAVSMGGSNCIGIALNIIIKKHKVRKEAIILKAITNSENQVLRILAKIKIKDAIIGFFINQSSQATEGVREDFKNILDSLNRIDADDRFALKTKVTGSEGKIMFSAKFEMHQALKDELRDQLKDICFKYDEEEEENNSSIVCAFIEVGKEVDIDFANMEFRLDESGAEVMPIDGVMTKYSNYKKEYHFDLFKFLIDNGAHKENFLSNALSLGLYDCAEHMLLSGFKMAIAVYFIASESSDDRRELAKESFKKVIENLLSRENLDVEDRITLAKRFKDEINLQILASTAARNPSHRGIFTDICNEILDCIKAKEISLKEESRFDISSTGGAAGAGAGSSGTVSAGALDEDDDPYLLPFDIVMMRSFMQEVNDYSKCREFILTIFFKKISDYLLRSEDSDSINLDKIKQTMLLAADFKIDLSKECSHDEVKRIKILIFAEILRFVGKGLEHSFLAGERLPDSDVVEGRPPILDKGLILFKALIKNSLSIEDQKKHLFRAINEEIETAAVSSYAADILKKECAEALIEKCIVEDAEARSAADLPASIAAVAQVSPPAADVLATDLSPLVERGIDGVTQA